MPPPPRRDASHVIMYSPSGAPFPTRVTVQEHNRTCPKNSKLSEVSLFRIRVRVIP